MSTMEQIRWMEKESKQLLSSSRRLLNLAQLTRTSGVYCIVNKVDGKVYVGQSVSVHTRLAKHVDDLCLGVHNNRELQKDVLTFGLNKFDAHIVLTCEPAWLAFWESEIICDILQAGYGVYNRVWTISTKRHALMAKRFARNPGRLSHTTAIQEPAEGLQKPQFGA